MDQLKFQIDEIVNKLKERSTGQSDLFEMIGKLEQAKSSLLVEAMHPINPLHSWFFDDLEFQQPAYQQPAHVAGGQQVAGGVADDQQVAGGVALQVAGGVALQVAGGMADDQQVAGGVADVLQVAGGMADDQQVAGGVADDLRWMRSWDLCDDDTFIWMSPAPIPWFTIKLDKAIERDFLDIDATLGTILVNASPPTCFLKSPNFSSVGMPVTLTSSKLTDIVTCPAVFMKAGQGLRYALSWPVLGRRFFRHSTIRLWYQWKSLPAGWKHKLFITIESASAEAGPSNQTTGRKRRNMQ